MIRIINKFFTAIATVALLMIFITTLLQILFRQIGYVAPWTSAAARSLNIWLTFLGATVLIYDQKLINIELIEEKIINMSDKIKFLYNLITNSIILLVSIAMAYGARIMYIQTSNTRITGLPRNITTSYLYLAVLIAAIIIIIYILQNIINIINKRKGKL